MPTLIATPMAINANSYCTLAEGDAYHDIHLYGSTWTDADDDNKVIALIWATRLLDERCEWMGGPTTQTQALRWPRLDVYDQDDRVFDPLVIPQWLKNATAEFARHLLTKDRLQAMDDNVAGLKSVQAGSVSVEFDSMDRIDLLPPSVENIIRNYTKTSSSGGMIVPLVRA